MGRRIDEVKLRDIAVDLANGKPFRTISRDRHVDRNTVRRIELSLDIYAQPYPPHSVTQGRPRLLLKFQEDVSKHTKRERLHLVLMLSNMKGLLKFLREKPTAYLDEVEEFLLDEYGAVASEATIFRTLERAKWSRKLASKHAKERSEALREVSGPSQGNGNHPK